jgi:hypothetical protein
VTRWLLLALTGSALALLGLAGGLAEYVDAPRMQGASPVAALQTVHFQPSGSRRGHADPLSLRQLANVEAELNDLSDQALIVARVERRPVGLAGEARRAQSIAFVSGPLGSALGLQVFGQRPDWPGLRQSLPGGGERQALISERLAVAGFGSVQAALGQSLQALNLMEFRVQGTVEIPIVGVVMDGFSGPLAEQPVEIWMPLQAWQDVVLPAHQLDEVADEAPDFVALVSTETLAGLTTQLNRALAADPELDHQALLLPGVGPAPERRLALSGWSAMLRAAALAIALALAALHICQRWLALERAREQDRIRACLGENRPRWWRRKLGLLLRDLAVLLLTAGLSWWLLGRLAALSSMPLAESMANAARPDTGLLAQGLGVLLLVLCPLLLHLALGRRLQTLASRLGSYALLLVGVAMATTLLGAMLASLSADHARLLSQRSLGWPQSPRWQAELTTTSSEAHAAARHTLDRRPLQGLLDGSDESVALATLAPLGSGDAVHAQLRAGERSWRGRLQLNEVSAGYFPLLGLPINGNCPDIAELPADTVIVNQAFLRRYAGQVPLNSIDLQLTILAEGIFPQRLRICGSVADIQYGDARAAPLPTVYRRAQRIGAVGHVLAADPTALDSFRTTLAEHFPDLQLGQAHSLQAALAANLAQETAMARLARGIALAAGLIALLLTAQVVLLAAQLQAGNLATRWAVGATRPRLLLRLLQTRAWLPWVATLLLLISASLIAMHSVPPQGAGAIANAVAAGLAAVGFALLLGLLPAWRWLNEPRLRKALASERALR